MTLGTYDGVHRGHQAILSRMLEQKREMEGARTLLVTFDPHPQEVLKKHDRPIELLTTLEERLEIFERAGLDEVLIIEFTKEFSKTTYEDFLNNVLIGALGTVSMVVGYNHSFGKDRQGDVEHLKKMALPLGIRIEAMPPYMLDGEPVSSTRIRNALREARLAEANDCLAYRYTLMGSVVTGDRRGTDLGFPTANLQLPVSKILPADGVYSAVLKIGGTQHRGALSIGTKPTFKESAERVAEVFVLDYSGDLYGEQIAVECVDFLRPQIKFEDAAMLSDQIAQDVDYISTLQID